MNPSIRRSLIVLATSIFFGTSALAQFVWLDEKGNKQFSDQPPPSTVPKHKILKFNGKMFDEQDAPTATEGKTEAKEKHPETLADKELAYKKRKSESDEKAKKEAEDAKNTASKTENCKRMREYKVNLDSGQRINQMDANGNRSYMSDEKRVQEQTAMAQNLKDCSN